MLLILLACFYITLICFTWGVCLYELLKNFVNKEQTEARDFSITCLLGLSGIIILAGVLSLVMPLGGLGAQLIILLPCVILIFSPAKRSLWLFNRTWLPFTQPAVLFLFFSCLLLLLVMGSWKIIHPDTLGYHSQTIQWIEDYKVIPGLVHLNLRYGYQGLWFPACALFSLKFPSGNSVAYLNITVVIWYLVFVTRKINAFFSEKEKSGTWLPWLALLGISLWSYTQVRLTATSFSPDFIATIYVWVILYLFLGNTRQSGQISNENLVLILFLCFTAVTIKLSSIPILLLAAYAMLIFLKQKKIRLLFLALVIVVLTLFPFIARNSITSGYFFFPVGSTDVIETDWKFDKELTLLDQKYITAYAKTETAYSSKEIEATLGMKITEWLPIWWKNRSVADQIITIIFIFSIIAAFFFIKRIVSSDRQIKIALITTTAGCIFWFSQAPDPRFGFGFIIGFIAIVNFVIVRKNIQPTLFHNSKLVTGTLLITAVIVSGYITYRFTSFFSGNQWIWPKGIEKKDYRKVMCNDIIFQTPSDNGECAGIPVPCVNDSCKTFILRGNKITHGFKAKK
ncbi:MAG: LIC_10190 family membrane protein [Chitinophagaceae bacterium]